jgi:hypothetical protein
VTEWWTYRPSDFLMFSPRIYWRLFEDINLAAWPLGLAAVVLGLALLAWCWRQPRSERPARLTPVLLAVAWGYVAWAFLWQRFAPIQWAATAFALAFAVQAAGLLASARAPLGGATHPLRRCAGLALAAWALVLHPLLAWAQGRPWQQAELFSLAPDPTALATLAWLLIRSTRQEDTRGWHGALWLMPLAWCVVSGATLFTMGSMQGAVPLTGAGLAVAAVAADYWGRRMRKRCSGPISK